MKHVAKVFLILKYYIAECYSQSMVQLSWPQDSYNHLSLATVLLYLFVRLSEMPVPLIQPVSGLHITWLENGYLSGPVGVHPGTILLQ